jgi:hypothetical protein
MEKDSIQHGKKVKTEKKQIELEIGEIDEELVINLQQWQEDRAREKTEKIREQKRKNYKNQTEGRKLTIKQKYEIYHDYKPIVPEIMNTSNSIKKESGTEGIGTAEKITKDSLILEAMGALDNMILEPETSSAGTDVEVIKNEIPWHRPAAITGMEGRPDISEVIGRSMTNHNQEIDEIQIAQEEFSLPMHIFKNCVKKTCHKSITEKVTKIVRKHKKLYLLAQMRKIRTKMQRLKRLQNIAKYGRKKKEKQKWKMETDWKRNKKSMAFCMNRKTKNVSYFNCKLLKHNDKIFQCKCIVLVHKLNTPQKSKNRQPHLDMYSKIKRCTRTTK